MLLTTQALSAECALAPKGAGFHGGDYTGKTGQSQLSLLSDSTSSLSLALYRETCAPRPNITRDVWSLLSVFSNSYTYRFIFPILKHQQSLKCIYPCCCEPLRVLAAWLSQSSPLLVGKGMWVRPLPLKSPQGGMDTDTKDCGLQSKGGFSWALGDSRESGKAGLWKRWTNKA